MGKVSGKPVTHSSLSKELHDLTIRSSLRLEVLGCRRSPVDSSVPSILLHRIQSPSTPSMVLSNYIWIVTCRKHKNKQKEAGIGPLKKVWKCSRVFGFSYLTTVGIRYSEGLLQQLSPFIKTYLLRLEREMLKWNCFRHHPLKLFRSPLYLSTTMCVPTFVGMRRTCCIFLSLSVLVFLSFSVHMFFYFLLSQSLALSSPHTLCSFSFSLYPSN